MSATYHHPKDERSGRAANDATDLPERGSAVVEFALVLPVFALLLMAIIDFGIIFSRDIAVHQGVREGARAGVVAHFGSTTSCLNPFTPGQTPSTDMQALMCVVKNRIGVTPSSDVFVKVLFDSTYNVNAGLVVCAMTPARSATGFTSSLVGSHFLRSKVEMSIEQVSGSPELPGEEAPPSGANWSWCTAAGTSP
jgi:hypothetical protein